MTNWRNLWAAFGRRGTDAAGGWRDLLAWILTGLVILAVSVLYNELGMLHFEWAQYVPFHLGPGSIWAKIFDNRTLDQGVYAGRELSYLIDHLDMLVVARSVQGGWPVFVSVVHVTGCVALGVWIARFAARDLGLGSLVALLLALLFWTTPYVYLHFLMRTAKVLTAMGAVVVVTEIYRACRANPGQPEEPLPFWRGALIATGAGVMSFSDRQGFYFLLCAIGLMAGEWLLARTRVARGIVLVLLGVLAVELVYFFWIAPALTKALWGYAPDFSFNQLPLAELLARPGEFSGQAARLVAQNVGFTLGQIPVWAVFTLLAAGATLALFRGARARTRPAHLPPAAVMAALLLGLWVMYALMILRHPPLLWPDLQVVYYWIPGTTLVVIGMAVASAGWVAAHNGRRTALVLALLVLVGCNLAAIPGHRRVFEQGHLHESLRHTRAMLDILRHHQSDDVVPRELDDIAAFRTLLALAPVRPPPLVPWQQYGDGGFYLRTRSSGASMRFLLEFGGSVDSRFLRIAHPTPFFPVTDGGSFIGTTAEPLEMLVGVPANRLQADLYLQRKGPDLTAPLAADFVIYAQPDATGEPRFERWRGRVELPPGEANLSVRQEIDGSGLLTLFRVEIPAESAGRLVAGWRNPDVTHVARDSSNPAWLLRSNAPVAELDEAALAKLLPGSWRPTRALMRKGRVTAEGVELSPGGEIWLQVPRLMSKFSGRVVPASDRDRDRVIETWGAWYKGGRLQIYKSPSTTSEQRSSQSFHAWSAEPGGWLVILNAANPELARVLVQVLEVEEAR